MAVKRCVLIMVYCLIDFALVLLLVLNCGRSNSSDSLCMAFISFENAGMEIQGTKKLTIQSPPQPDRAIPYPLMQTS